MHQNQTIMNNDTLKQPSAIPAGSTIAIQCNAGGPWTNGTIVKQGNVEYKL